MNEYISREDVQGQIVKAAEKRQIKLFDKSVNVILQILQNMPTADVQPINRWIKADESLPVYGGMVLICDKSKNIRLGIYTDMGWCSQCGNPMMCKITHWQSLPEPPKDGDTE